jgi:hypothetical protein
VTDKRCRKAHSAHGTASLMMERKLGVNTMALKAKLQKNKARRTGPYSIYSQQDTIVCDHNTLANTLLQGVVHIKLYRMRSHAETRDFFHFEVDISI